jgi:HEAT repeat protein
VEGLWGANTPEASLFLQLCTRDWSNRVSGNAWIGLHLAGQPDIAREVMRMAEDSRTPFRSTAAWAMGKIGAEEFVPRLFGLFADEGPVRSAAMRALIGIWEPQAKTPEAIMARAAATMALPSEQARELSEMAGQLLGISAANSSGR